MHVVLIFAVVVVCSLLIHPILDKHGINRSCQRSSAIGSIFLQQPTPSDITLQTPSRDAVDLFRTRAMSFIDLLATCWSIVIAIFLAYILSLSPHWGTQSCYRSITCSCVLYIYAGLLGFTNNGSAAPRAQRITPDAVFSKVGVDYAVPLYVKQLRISS